MYFMMRVITAATICFGIILPCMILTLHIVYQQLGTEDNIYNLQAKHQNKCHSNKLNLQQYFCIKKRY